jgi:hypothetical protein
MTAATLIGFRGSIVWQSSLLTGKKTGISAIQPSSRLENISDFSSVQFEFPARQNRELNRDNRASIPRIRPEQGLMQKQFISTWIRQLIH